MPPRAPLASWIAAAAVAATLALPGCSGGDAPATPTFDGERAYAILTELVEMGPRITDSYAMRLQQELVRTTLTAAGAGVVEQRWKEKVLDGDEELELVNIIGRFRPELTDRVVLASHYDARREAELDPDPAARSLAIPGANDSGSGTAVLLHLVEILAEHAPPVGVDVIFFDGEEWGKPGRGGYCKGSQHLAERFETVYQKPPRWMICIDMIGDAHLEIPFERNSLATAPELCDRIWSLAAELGATAFVRTDRWSIEDDHTAFARRGVPAVLLIDYEYVSADGKTNYYHTQGDTLERCSAASLDQVGRVLLEMVMREAPAR